MFHNIDYIQILRFTIQVKLNSLRLLLIAIRVSSTPGCFFFHFITVYRQYPDITVQYSSESEKLAIIIDCNTCFVNARVFFSLSLLYIDNIQILRYSIQVNLNSLRSFLIVS